MPAGQYQRGDIVSAVSGSPTGSLRVTFATDFYRKDPITGQPISSQLLRCKQLEPSRDQTGQATIWTNRPDIVGGHLFDLLDVQVVLVSSVANTP